ncbi:hypothetical protein Nepgr_025715 [Nepenthes gracilis]|uniref:Uncharacterized protein n=1 Tax=Nepenthes gracilis TaxID=150966 RepID=A0AAD3T720_NEPGR|nr:hypothetical protein Nepgr_025715 [Nepenthes gracilis]
MDSNNKRRGFVKPKLMSSISRAANHFTSKVVRAPNRSSSSVSYIANLDMAPQPVYTASTVIFSDGGLVHDDNTGQLGEYFGAIADDRIDMKAASYINCVRERFRIEQTQS